MPREAKDVFTVHHWVNEADRARAIGRSGETYNIEGNSERSDLEVVKLACTLPGYAPR